MTYFSEISSSSTNEIKILINYFREIKIKDSLIADSLETPSSVLLSNKFFEAYFQRDSYPVHEEIKSIIRGHEVHTKYGILDYTENKVEVANVLSDIEEPVTEEKIDELIKAARDNLINNYEDGNPYYLNLQKIGVPIWISRFANDFDLIYEPPTTEIILSKFKDSFRKSRRFFMSSMYNKAFTSDATVGEGISRKNTYHAFCRLTICLMTLIDILNSRMKNPFDFDFLSETDVDQFLFSFGFTEFKEFPLKYKKRLVDSINRLIKKKGTDAIFVDIMSIFDFKGLNLIRYHLLIDKVVLDENGYPVVTKDPRFVGYNLNLYNEISDAIKIGDYKEISYEEMTEDDPTWIVTKEEVANINESHLASKFFSLSTSINLTKNSADTALLINLIKETFRKNPEKFNLYVYNSKISSSKISLVNAIVALQCIVCDYYGIEDLIIFSESGNEKIFSFNNDDSNVGFEKVYNEYTETLVLLGTDSVDELNDSTLASLFNYNEKKKEAIDDYLANIQRTHLFTPEKMKDMKASYAAKFTSKFNQETYMGYSNYNLWLRDQDPELYKYVQMCFNESESNKRELIIELMDTLTDYCAATTIRFDSLFNSEVALYVKQLIDVFKSYTVTLKDFKVYYSLDEKLFFALIEEVKALGKLLEKEVFSVGDIQVMANLMRLKENNFTLALDRFDLRSTGGFFSRLHFVNELKFRNRIFKANILSNLADYCELFRAGQTESDSLTMIDAAKDLVTEMFSKEIHWFNENSDAIDGTSFVNAKSIFPLSWSEEVKLSLASPADKRSESICLHEKVATNLLPEFMQTIKEIETSFNDEISILISRLTQVSSGCIYDVPECSSVLNRSGKAILTDSFSLTIVNG